MTPTERARLRELLTKATPGPYRLHEKVARIAKDGERYLVVGAPDRWIALLMEEGTKSEEDAALIVALVNAAPTLLDAADRLAEAEKALRTIADGKTAAFHPDGLDAQSIALRYFRPADFASHTQPDGETN